jgi:hypothetical protein
LCGHVLALDIVISLPLNNKMLSLVFCRVIKAASIAEKILNFACRYAYRILVLYCMQDTGRGPARAITLALGHAMYMYLAYNRELCVSKTDSIKTYDFSTIHTTIPHNKLKPRLLQIIDNSFLNKNGTRKYRFVVIGKQDTYFVRHNSDSPYKYSEVDIKSTSM